MESVALMLQMSMPQQQVVGPKQRPNHYKSVVEPEVQFQGQANDLTEASARHLSGRIKVIAANEALYDQWKAAAGAKNGTQAPAPSPSGGMAAAGSAEPGPERQAPSHHEHSGADLRRPRERGHHAGPGTAGQDREGPPHGRPGSHPGLRRSRSPLQHGGRVPGARHQVSDQRRQAARADRGRQRHAEWSQPQGGHHPHPSGGQELVARCRYHLPTKEGTQSCEPSAPTMAPTCRSPARRRPSTKGSRTARPSSPPCRTSRSAPTSSPVASRATSPTWPPTSPRAPVAPMMPRSWRTTPSRCSPAGSLPPGPSSPTPATACATWQPLRHAPARARRTWMARRNPTRPARDSAARSIAASSTFPTHSSRRRRASVMMTP